MIRPLMVAVLLPVLAAGAVHAQAPSPEQQANYAGPVWGPRFGYDLDACGVDASKPFLGVQLGFPVGHRLVVEPSFEWYRAVAGPVYRLNADARYHLPFAGDHVYLGAGLAIPHHAGGHSPGTDFMVGWGWRRVNGVSPFTEAKWVFFSAYTSFNLLTGVTVGL